MFRPTHLLSLLLRSRMQARFALCCTLTLLLPALGCPAPGSAADAGPGLDPVGPGTDGGQMIDNDAGIADAGAPRPASDTHTSYIPPGLAPTAAAHLLVLGDSISVGVGATSRPRDAYFSLLFEDDTNAVFSEPGIDLKTLFGADLQLVPLAESGAETADTRNVVCDGCSIESSFSAAGGWPPVGHTIVVITIGGNDIQGELFGGDPTGQVLDTAMANIATVVDFLQDPANFPDGTSIYLSNIYDPSDGEEFASACFFGVTIAGISSALDVWSQRYVDLATEKGIAIIDSLGQFQGHGWNFENAENPFYDAEDPTNWFFDCVHPNDRGHHELRRLFFEAIDGTYVAN